MQSSLKSDKKCNYIKILSICKIYKILILESLSVYLEILSLNILK